MKTSRRFTSGYLRLWTSKSAMNAALAAFAGVSLMVGASLGLSQTIPNNAQNIANVPAPMFASWFDLGFPTLNGSVKPADSLNFSDIPNVDFYRWSWNMFLWLTSPAPPKYGGSGFIFNSPVFFDVSPPDASGVRHFFRHKAGSPSPFGIRVAPLGPHNLPIVISKSGKVFEVVPQKLSSKGLPIVTDWAGNEVEVGRTRIGADQKTVFFDVQGRPISNPKAAFDADIIRTKKGIGALDPKTLVQKFSGGGTRTEFLSLAGIMETEVNQADNGVLMSQNGSLVYYGSMVNDVYAYFLTGTKNGGIPPTPQNSIVVGGITIFRFPTDIVGLTEVTNFAAANGFSIVDPEALAVELKTSWVDAATVTDPSKYIIVAGEVPVYDTTDPNHWVQTGTTIKKLAMVGMHVVGSARHHPEMIWATFEHFGNSPNTKYRYIDTLGNVVPGPFDPGPWEFSSLPGGPVFNSPHMTYDPPTTDINSVIPFTISPSDTNRVHPWGMLGTAAFSNTEIIAIDHSVLTQLIPGDYRANYFMTGTTWTIGGAPPNGGNEVGTNQLANTTMETYSQSINCFACHQSTFGSPVSTTDVSHIFAPLKPLF